MARKIMGKQVYEAICPLCKTGYFMTDDEIFFVDSEDESNHEVYFYCDICERNVKVDPSKNRNSFKPQYISTRFEWD